MDGGLNDTLPAPLNEAEDYEPGTPVVVTDKAGNPVGASQDYDLDLDYGFGDDVQNDYSLTVYEPKLVPLMGDCSFFYIDGTDIGGIVDRVKDSISNGIPTVTFEGRTWSGMLAGKVIGPDENQKDTKQHFQGSCADYVSWVIGQADLSDLMVSSVGGGQIDITLDPYITCWEAIRLMLDKNGMKVLFREIEGTVYLSCEQAGDYTSDADMLDFTMEKDFRRVNHMVGLGAGRGRTRLRVDWYADQDGNLSEDQKITGIREITGVYEHGGGDQDKDSPADPMALTKDEQKTVANKKKAITDAEARVKTAQQRRSSVESAGRQRIDAARKKLSKVIRPRNYRWKSARRRRDYLNSVAARNRTYHQNAIRNLERVRASVARSQASAAKSIDRARAAVTKARKAYDAARQKIVEKRQKMVKELSDATKKQLQQLQGKGSLSATIHEGADLDVGDVVNGWDPAHKVKVTADVSRKIVQASHGVLTVTYEIGRNAVLTGGTYQPQTGSGSNIMAVTGAWPIGSIYMNTSNTNPSDSTLIGYGTWVKRPSLGAHTWERTG